jgi:N-carbamoyl-L-amino-acid hydrolase
MPLRQDAGMALINFAYRLNQAFEKIAGPRTVWTMGRVAFYPGAPSIIPGRAEMHLQFRDPETSRLEAFEAKTHELIAEANRKGPVDVSIEPVGKPIQPADMDTNFQRHIAAAAERIAPGKWSHMPSAAIHDAMFLAQVMPAGMLFVPSINGISHDFAEDTSEADIVRGCQVMATAVASILTEGQ